MYSVFTDTWSVVVVIIVDMFLTGIEKLAIHNTSPIALFSRARLEVAAEAVDMLLVAAVLVAVAAMGDALLLYDESLAVAVRLPVLAVPVLGGAGGVGRGH